MIGSVFLGWYNPAVLFYLLVSFGVIIFVAHRAVIIANVTRSGAGGFNCINLQVFSVPLGA